MKVTLIDFTHDAVNVLLFTKATRLNLSPALLDEIRAWPIEKKMAELAYMAGTNPGSWEFVHYAFLVQGVSRACTHQIVRTRQASYAQQSMRVVPMEEYEYIFTERNRESPEAMAIIHRVNRVIREAYAELIQIGQPPEDARGILPTNIATNISGAYNLRVLSDLVKSRSGGRTQQEYQRVVKAMANAVLDVHPWAEQFLYPKPRNYFDDIEAFAHKEWPDNLIKKGELLKIVDKLRQNNRKEE
jgi:thymidylate synthase (FAD)